MRKPVSLKFTVDIKGPDASVVWDAFWQLSTHANNISNNEPVSVTIYEPEGPAEPRKPA